MRMTARKSNYLFQINYTEGMNTVTQILKLESTLRPGLFSKCSVVLLTLTLISNLTTTNLAGVKSQKITAQI